MWSHYSRNHTGVCLEFRVRGTKFTHAWEVEYQEEYPAFIFGLSDPVRILIVKSDAWAYEEEFRLVCPHSTNLPDYPLLLDGSYLSIGPDALESVIVGCQADYDAIKSLVAKHAPGLRTKLAIRSPDKYRLEIPCEKSGVGRPVRSKDTRSENTTSWRLKIARAKEHLATLQKEIPEWLRTCPIAINICSCLQYARP